MTTHNAYKLAIIIALIAFLVFISVDGDRHPQSAKDSAVTITNPVSNAPVTNDTSGKDDRNHSVFTPVVPVEPGIIKDNPESDGLGETGTDTEVKMFQRDSEQNNKTLYEESQSTQNPLESQDIIFREDGIETKQHNPFPDNNVVHKILPPGELPLSKAEPPGVPVSPGIAAPGVKPELHVQAPGAKPDPHMPAPGVEPDPAILPPHAQ